MRAMKAILVVVAIAVTLLLGTEATVYTVGDDLGWVIPPGGAATYAAWAAKHSFVVNDELKFNFEAGEQDLAFVWPDDYESCNTANPISLYKAPSTLTFLGGDYTYHFTSTLAGHCAKGQKIAIYIGDAVSPSPSPNPFPSSGVEDSLAEAAEHPKFVAHRIVAN